jgi:hypothetical protein
MKRTSLPLLVLAAVHESADGTEVAVATPIGKVRLFEVLRTRGRTAEIGRK